MKIPHIQVNAFIMNAFKRTYSGSFKVKPSISLQCYLESQMDFNIVTPLFGRPIKVYTEALKHLQGDKQYSSSFEQAIRWYYCDLAQAVFNCADVIPDGFKIVDEQFPSDFELSSLKLETIKEELSALLEGQFLETEIDIFSILENIPISLRASVKATTALAQAVVLYHLAHQKKLNVMEV